MASTHPIKISGRWREGFALDYHILSSTYLGDDEYGHPMFDTKRTELGALLYRLKYRSDGSVIDELANTAAQFVSSWNPGAGLIIPVPPSKSYRPEQPVILLAEALGKHLSVPVALNCVIRVKNLPELKNVYDYPTRLRLLQGAHSVKQGTVEGKKILLFDDVYRSGATLNAVTEALYEEGRAAEVYALTLTLTQSKP